MGGAPMLRRPSAFSATCSAVRKKRTSPKILQTNRGKHMDEFKERLRGFLARHMNGRSLGDDEEIFSTGFVSSMFAMQLVLFLEKDFKIAVANEDLDLANFQTINAIAGLIERKMQPAQSAAS
jgi:acyl carrier protein